MLGDLDLDLVRDFGTALLIGGLLGLEREKRNTREGQGTAGLRSFVLLATIGAIGGLFAQKLQMPSVLVGSMLGAAAIVVTAYVAGLRRHPDSIGITTEIASLVTCLLGALVTTGYRELAIGLGVATAAVLAYKQPLHALVGRLESDDVYAGLRLLLATFVVLPLLPDRAIDPWGAINPYTLWLLVLLISGLSLVGYVVTRWLGPGKGIAATAASGGLVSSTAVTLTFLKQSREQPENATQLAGGILLAWTVMFVRVLVAATVVTQSLFWPLLPAFLAMAVASALGSFLCMVRHRRSPAAAVAASVPMKNPFSLLAAAKFAAIFSVVQLVLRIGQQHLPAGGTYAVAALAGLTDVDAITLTMAQHVRETPDASNVAVVAIAVASATNTLVKAALASLMGRHLGRPVVLATVAIFAAGAAALLLG